MYSPPGRNDNLIITLMILFSGAIIYSIYIFNPYFMNRKPLSESLSENQNNTLTIPLAQIEADSLGPWLYIEPQNSARTYVYNPDHQMEITYVREASTPLPEKVELNSPPPFWTTDGTGHYYTYQNQIVKTNFNNEKVWFFHSLQKDQFVNLPTVGSKYLFVASQQGFLYKINKDNGHLSWLIKYPGELQHNFLPYNSFLFFITKENKEHFYINKINGQTGELLWKTTLLGFTDPSEITINESLKLLLITDPNGSLLCLDSTTGNAYWQKKKLGGIITAASTLGESAYIANKEGLAISLNLKKRQMAWEYTLPSPAISNFAYIPSHGLVAILTDSGYLQTIEARTGEGHWRFNTESKQENKRLFSIRINQKGINKYKLNWSHKGWTLVSPCKEDRLCVFNPEKGQLINRIRLRGQLAQHMPIFIEDKMYALLKKPEKLPWINSSEPEPPFSMGTYKVYHAVKEQNKPTTREITETLQE